MIPTMGKHDILKVTLPWLPRTSFRQFRQLNIDFDHIHRAQRQQPTRLHRLSIIITDIRESSLDATFPQLFEQATTKQERSISTGRPRCIHVTKQERRIGEIRHHHAAPDVFLRGRQRAPIDGE